MDFKEIRHGSAEYDKAIQLRRAVLRLPLGLEYTEEQLAAEVTERHFVAECGESGSPEFLASACLTEEEPGLARIRQVAVREDCQGRGLGREIMEFTEAEAKAAGYEKVILCSRHYAIPFYERLGYQCVSDWFEEVGMPHRSMLKSL